ATPPKPSRSLFLALIIVGVVSFVGCLKAEVLGYGFRIKEEPKLERSRAHECVTIGYPSPNEKCSVPRSDFLLNLVSFRWPEGATQNGCLSRTNNACRFDLDLVRLRKIPLFGTLCLHSKPRSEVVGWREPDIFDLDRWFVKPVRRD